MVGVQDGLHVNLTVSLGLVYCCSGFSGDSRQMLEMAGAALNESRHRGRNCYTVKFLGKPDLTIE